LMELFPGPFNQSRMAEKGRLQSILYRAEIGSSGWRAAIRKSPDGRRGSAVMATYRGSCRDPNDLLWDQTGSTLSAHKAGNEVMRPSIPAFAATDPDIYERFTGRWSARMAGPFLSFAGVESGQRVLDVGCGTGTITLALAQRGCTAVGVDPSEAYL